MRFAVVCHAPDVLENPFIIMYISLLMMRIFYGIQTPSPFEEKHIPRGPWFSSIIFSSGCMEFFQMEDLFQPHPSSPLQKTINFDRGRAISYNFSLDPTFSLQLAGPTWVGGALVMSLGQTLCIQDYVIKHIVTWDLESQLPIHNVIGVRWVCKTKWVCWFVGEVQCSSFGNTLFLMAWYGTLLLEGYSQPTTSNWAYK